MTFLLTAWQWLISNPWRGACVGLAATLAFYMFILVPGRDLTIANQKTKIAELKSSVEIQNAAVAAWKAAAARAMENQKKAMEEADKVMIKTVKGTTVILDRPVPAPDKECEETLKLLKEFQR